MRKFSVSILMAIGSCIASLPTVAEIPLDEIIVMVQKREQNIQDIPVAVTSWDADDIRESGMQTIERLTDLHPSVSFDQAHSFQNSSLKIRGIGTIGVSRTFEGSVGTFFDGVYRTRSGMALVDMLDIERLDILRGPQNTLYGKNTVAGAIALESHKPNTEEVDGYAEVRLGNFDSRYLTAAGNVPVSDSVGLRRTPTTTAEVRARASK